jgi:caa(3)-type oxidase subunit IV
MTGKELLHPDVSAAGRSPAAHGSLQYLVAFAVLCGLTLVELGVLRSPGIPRPAALVALVGIAVAKAALIALFYMHLRYETRILRLTVLGPLVAPGIYGLLLMADAAWRFLR